MHEGSKMAEHLSVSEIEKEAKKLKRDLEGWREIIIPVNSILLWEKNFHLGVILATTSVIFLLLWQINPSILSMVSLLGIIVTIVDFLVPTLTLHFCHAEQWTSAKERKLESICRSLAANKIFLTNFVKTFYQMKRDRPKCYYLIVIVTLLFLSWIGNAVNNLFLTYIVVTGLLLLPGVQQRGLIEKYTSCVSKMVKDKIGYGDNLKTD